MRRQDELLTLYPRLDPFNRKFVLSEIDGLSKAFDSEELLEFLQIEQGAREPLLADQAFFELVLFLPGFIQRKYGLTGSSAGLWTAFLQGAAAKASTGTLADAGRPEALRTGAFRVLDPLVPRLLELADSEAPSVRRQARLAVAQFPFRRVQDRVLERLSGQPVELDLLMAFARAGGGLDHEAALLKQIEKFTQEAPSCALALVGLRSGIATRAIQAGAGGWSRLGRANAAVALSKMPEPSLLDAIRTLERGGESWVSVYALRALEQQQTPEAFDEIRRIHDRTPHEFVKIQAIRAAGGIPGKASLDFCLERVSDRSPAVQAQALESLVRKGCPAAELRRRAAPLVNSASLKARVNAMLAAADGESGLQMPPFQEMVRDERSLLRLEAAYLLGYWQGAAARRYLHLIALRDPDESVRIQAVKSLSRYPAEQALPTLLAVLSAREDRTALTASRVMTRYRESEARTICEALRERRGQAPSAFESSLILRVLGSLGAMIDLPAIEADLVRGLESNDARVQVGALEGWKLYGHPRATDASGPLARLCKSRDVNLAARAHMVSFLHGDLAAVEGLRALLDRPAGSGLERALDACLELGLLGSEVIPAGRFARLADSLTTRHDAEPGAKLELSRCWKAKEVGGFETGEDIDPGDPLPSTGGGARPSTQSPALDSVLGELEKKYQSPGKRPAARIDGELQKASYLVGGSLDARLEAEHRLGGLPSPMRRLAAFLLVYKWLVAPFFALALIAMVVLLAASSEPRLALGTDRPRPVLTVALVVGEAQYEADKRPLVSGSVIRLHEVVVTGAGGRVELLSAQGGRITVQAGTRFVATKLSKDGAQMKVDLTPGGAVDLDFRGKENVVVQCGDQLLGGVDARWTLQSASDRAEVRADQGVVRTRGVDEEEARALAPGETHVITLRGAP